MSWLRISSARKQAGDTIVEVLMAIVVISVIIAGAYQVTNQGLRIGQNAIERTQASEVSEGQAEVLRTLRDEQIISPESDGVWKNILDNFTTITKPTYTACQPSSGSSPFYLTLDASNVNINSGTATDGYLQYWIEAYEPSGADYVDFHIRGCWQGIGDQGLQETGIVVRLLK